MSRRAKISRIEELIASKLKAQQERRKQWAKALPIHAQRHATAVAAIALAGEPRDLQMPSIGHFFQMAC
jgi:hypothetical protein